MKEKIHWRKTAKTCSECNKVTSAKKFLPGLEKCVRCSYNDVIFSLYKECGYCRRWLEKEKIPGALCDKCKEFAMENHHKFKDKPRLPKNVICTVCQKTKQATAFDRGDILENIVCKACKTIQRLIDEGKFRCKGCATVFAKEEIFWNKYCQRCYEKNKIWNMEMQRKLRQNPEYREWQRITSRWYYYNVFKPVYNKVLMLQMCHGLTKQRRTNRNGYWHTLNHSLWKSTSGRHFKSWICETEKVLNFIKTGQGRLVGEKVIFDKPTKEFRKYCDSDEAMEAAERPKWDPKEVFIKDIP